ncbi:MAG: hypothetical protein KDI56_08905 [Xanthomonadales bacterium]|nr:hypothetical protein [Xanthomonadales bacterium]
MAMHIVTVTTEPRKPQKPYRLGRNLASVMSFAGWLTAIIAGGAAIAMLVQHGPGAMLVVPWLLGGLALVLFGEVAHAVFDLAIVARSNTPSKDNSRR